MLDRAIDRPKLQVASDLGATYHVGDIASTCANGDIVIEATGVAELAFEAMRSTPHNGIVCLTGVTSPGWRVEAPAGLIASQLVLECCRRTAERAVVAFLRVRRPQPVLRLTDCGIAGVLCATTDADTGVRGVRHEA